MSLSTAVLLVVRTDSGHIVVIGMKGVAPE